ncbi:hypothetical protein ACJX0J_017491, partial [Zea mays]
FIYVTFTWTNLERFSFTLEKTPGIFGFPLCDISFFWRITQGASCHASLLIYVTSPESLHYHFRVIYKGIRDY